MSVCEIKWSRGKLRVKYLLIDSDLAALEPRNISLEANE